MLCFGAFELDIESCRLLRDGAEVKVEPQVLDVIAHLARHADRLVRKEELLDEVWGDRFVSESALTSRIKSARRALGDDGRTQSVIRTVHGRGYRFIAVVTDSEALPEGGGTTDGASIGRSGGTGDDVVVGAREAFEDARWHDAHRGYSAIGVDALSAADLECWAEAAWWGSDIVECIAIRQEAYRRYCRAADDQSAARVAIALSDDYLHRGTSTVAMTWLERASDLLVACPNCREAGQLLRLRSEYRLHLAHQPAVALDINATLRRLADVVDDPDLIAQSMQDHGRILLALGKVEEGMAIIDRAMLVAATTATSPGTLGRLYCNMLSACVELGHFKRAQDWSDEAISWCAGHADSPFPGVCEVHRAGLRRRSGDLEHTLADLEMLASNSQFSNITGSAMSEIGEIHLQRGNVDAAQAAFLHAHAHGVNASIGLARVAIEQGRSADAVELLQNSLVERADDELARRQLLPHLVDAAAVAGLVEIADSAARELSEITKDSSEACRACAARATGTVALLEGRNREATGLMRTAVGLYGAVALPFERAAARLGLAAAMHSLGMLQIARLERDAALAVLEEAGAVPSGTARLWLERLAEPG